jgi:hypothetical protein
MLSIVLEQVVEVETAIDGVFDVTLSWRPDGAGPDVQAQPPTARCPSARPRPLKRTGSARRCSDPEASVQERLDRFLHCAPFVCSASCRLEAPMRWHTLPLTSLVVVFLAAPAVAQEEPWRLTAPPAGAGFEILADGYGFVLRLDRRTGEVAQLIYPVRGSRERAWQRMDVPGLQSADAAAGPRYQLAAKPGSRYQTFLLDTVSGKSWYLSYENSNGTSVNVWQPLDEL